MFEAAVYLLIVAVWLFKTAGRQGDKHDTAGVVLCSIVGTLCVIRIFWLVGLTISQHSFVLS